MNATKAGNAAPKLTVSGVPGLWPLYVYVDDDVLRIWELLGQCGVPTDMVPHVWALLRAGANPDKLLHAIGRVRRGRPRRAKPKTARKRGAPALTAIPMKSLDYMVRVLRNGHVASSDKEAIRVFFKSIAEQIEHVTLRRYAREQPTHRVGEMSVDDFVTAMQQRLSRWRRTQDLLQK